MNSSEIRQAFINYFAKQGHQHVESSSLVPNNDPTLLFTNAGMVQFKETFLGLETRPYTRAVTSQRCVRAGGKHNDLENVGYTARHHTFFEMLGNFSFGDYFKRDAIQMAWTFLTEVLHLPPERLWVTVYHEDEEAAAIWLNDMGISSERFSRCGEADNFWSMGETGPCGPCTEIFYDHGPSVAGGPPGSAEADGDRYIEIWNLVFMQYNRDKHGQLHPLPKPSVDTGMGLERIAAVVQGVHNNYQIDSFQHIIKALVAMAPTIDGDHPSLKVIADHIRACSFLIVDGVLPSNEGRGYVLRRIIRRAVRHGHQVGLPLSFFSDLVGSLAEVMGEAYPELRTQQPLIESVLAQETMQFSRTMEQGLRLLQAEMANLSGTTIPGSVAFKLYDTYGFPIDLTADMAREYHLQVDMDGFNDCMQHQREQSQHASHFQVDYSTIEHVTEPSIFCGYDEDELDTLVRRIICDGASVDALSSGQQAMIILERTPFYAESGGQVGDKGHLISGSAVFRVDDTQRVGSAIAHRGALVSGSLVVGQAVGARIDLNRRDAIRLNHTATHLLHAALKQIVGSHVQQKGSLVDAERARFDFSHHEAVSREQLEAIESLVNAQIRLNHVVTTAIMAMNDAKQSGAVALFGEKYGDTVRVLSIGDFSNELCGGTHARRTGDIGLFKITAEYGVASGVRRIELVTGDYACRFVTQQLALLDELASQLKTTVPQLSDKLSQVLADAKHQEKERIRLQSKLTAESGLALKQAAKTIGTMNLLIQQIDGVDSHALRSLLDQLKSSLDAAVVVLYTIDQGTMHVVAGISKVLIGRVPSAGALVKHLCGKGGGRDDMAQGGGPVPDDIANRVATMELMIIEAMDQ